jgi:hypothetical protein
MFGIGCSDHLTVQDGAWTSESPAARSVSTDLAHGAKQTRVWRTASRRRVRDRLGAGLRWGAAATVLAVMVAARGLAAVSELLSLPDWLA